MKTFIYKLILPTSSKMTSNNIIGKTYHAIMSPFYARIVTLKEKDIKSVDIDQSSFPSVSKILYFFSEKDLPKIILFKQEGLPGQEHLIGFAGNFKTKKKEDIPTEKHVVIPVSRIPIPSLETKSQRVLFCVDFPFLFFIILYFLNLSPICSYLCGLAH